MISLRTCRNVSIAWLLALPAVPTNASSLPLPPDTPALLDKIYSFDLDGAVEGARRLEEAQPDHPLGYLLEAEALWWKIWCLSAEFKYGMTDARHRAKLDADQR